MSFLTLSQAAKSISKSKSTLNRAIKSGRLSAVRNEDGTFSIDPSELARAFPQNAPERAPVAHHEAHSERPGTEDSSKIDMLELLLEREREALAREREVSADLKEDRDRWRAQATGLLSDLRTAQERTASATSSEDPPAPQSKGFWKRLFS
ncbi:MULTISPECIES: hypothetical protein [unclassified Paracoccus (in: a-proteobacteria)]|uniref:hypothetical protein n=1 Tax=unclassified Paracoccus (in: a-proteobacteria) TaxID=2688777 RepID=UPI001F32087D|nr:MULTISPECIES: hypothetical protein [unclassified Paracoccus (in: a-proteobacteria)]QXL80117.1 hypothetical protein [Paracoccus sp. (in: a-proteobacteria)]